MPIRQQGSSLPRAFFGALLCCAARFVASTDAPTAGPTSVPTAEPTAFPTAFPTFAPRECLAVHECLFVLTVAARPASRELHEPRKPHAPGVLGSAAGQKV
jgi:hypothetical protein